MKPEKTCNERLPNAKALVAKARRNAACPEKIAVALALKETRAARAVRES